MKNLKNVPDFSCDDTVIVLGLDYPLDNQFELEGALQKIVSPLSTHTNSAGGFNQDPSAQHLPVLQIWNRNSFVKFGFSVKSYIFEFDAERQAFQKQFNVSRHDLQNEDESPGDDAEVPYFLQDGFGGTELEAWSGASSAFHFTANREQHYVLVANYWDGFRRNVSSVLLQM